MQPLIIGSSSSDPFLMHFRYLQQRSRLMNQRNVSIFDEFDHFHQSPFRLSLASSPFQIRSRNPWLMERPIRYVAPSENRQYFQKDDDENVEANISTSGDESNDYEERLKLNQGNAKPRITTPDGDFEKSRKRLRNMEKDRPMQIEAAQHKQPRIVENQEKMGTHQIRDIPARDIFAAFLYSHEESSNGKYFLPQLTVGDGNCLIHAASPDNAKVNLYGMWEADPNLCKSLRKYIAIEMRQNGGKMKSDYTGKFDEDDWYKDPRTGKYTLTDEGWNKWCDEIANTNAWFDVSATQALSRVLGKPILIAQPRANHFDGGERAADMMDGDYTDGLMNHYSFIYHDPRYYTSIRYFNISDLETVHRIFTEESPILVYYNGENHFSRCSVPTSL